MPGEEPVEMLGTAGFDFVLIDCEHGPADVADLRRHIAAAQVHGMAVLVRVGADEPALALRALDHGAAGIVVPHVDGPRDAERAVRAVRHPPLGDRGFATYGRAGGYGTVPAAEHLRRAEADVLLIVMAESEQGCDRAKEVLAVPGVDGVLVGPADLAVSMGEPGGQDGPRVRAAVDRVHREAAAAGRIRMDITGGAPAVRAAYASGADLVVVNLTRVLMDLFTGLASGPRPGGDGARGR